MWVSFNIITVRVGVHAEIHYIGDIIIQDAMTIAYNIFMYER